MKSLGAGLAIALAAGAAWADEAPFDAAAYEKKAVEIGGYAELRQEHFSLNRDGALYKLGPLASSGRSRLDRTTATLQLAGKLRHGIATFDLRSNSSTQHDATGEVDGNILFEGALSVRPTPNAMLEAGKRAMRWGKGYAWNPIGFVERAKDPNDPNLAREGLWMADGDFIANPGGAVRTIALTPVLLPVDRHTNADFGAPGHLNPAAKLSLLVHDIDLDFAWQAKGSRPARFGMDFSANIASNFEVHGEWARAGRTQRTVVDGTGKTSVGFGNPASWLVGLRYLTEGDTTYIAEYYRNGPGFTPGQLQQFSAFADLAFAQARRGSSALLQRAQPVAQGGYGRPNPGSDYLYFRAQQKDALGIVYFQPALTAMVNMGDRSWQLTPELLYAGFNNWELRLRASLLRGTDGSDFAQKQNSRKLEFYARYYF